MNSTNLTISQVAQLAQVNIETVRYYQRIGLITRPDKPLSGYRRYSAQTVKHIGFIKRAQHMGFSLKEIGSVFHPLATGVCHDISTLTANKVRMVECKLAELVQLKSTLDDLARHCITCRDQDVKVCAILQAMRK